tara:strand:- start:121 stop:810 length:690 start_codon:yes stop_codon:yes gene_type:complete
MGYQDKGSTTTVFAKLTTLGTQRILTDDASFNIRYFAPCDDEVDYRLWNPSHPDGTDYYGAQIEALPILEPTASPVYQVKSKLLLNGDPDAERASYFNLDNDTLHFSKDEAEETKDVHMKWGNSNGESFSIVNTNRKYMKVWCEGGTKDENIDPAIVKRQGATKYWSEKWDCPAGATIHSTVGSIQGGDDMKYSDGYGASSLVRIESHNSSTRKVLKITADGNTKNRNF